MLTSPAAGSDDQRARTMPTNPIGRALPHRRAGHHTLVRQPFTHALTTGIDPGWGGIPEGGLAEPSPVRGLRHGRGALGRRGWSGPMPIRSHGPHSYVFQLFALDHPPDLPRAFPLSAAVRAMTGHVIARARLDGTYEIR